MYSPKYLYVKLYCSLTTKLSSRNVVCSKRAIFSACRHIFFIGCSIYTSRRRSDHDAVYSLTSGRNDHAHHQSIDYSRPGTPGICVQAISTPRLRIGRKIIRDDRSRLHGLAQEYRGKLIFAKIIFMECFQKHPIISGFTGSKYLCYCTRNPLYDRR